MMTMRRQQGTYRPFILFCALAMLTTMLTYSNNADLASYFNQIMPFMWIACLVVLCFQNKYHIEIGKQMRLVLILYLIYFLKCKLFYYSGIYRSAGMGPANNLHLCCAYYIIGYNIRSSQQKTLKHILNVYYIGAIYLGVQCMLKAFTPGFDYMSLEAAHLSTLTGAAAVLLILVFRPKQRVLKIAAIGFSVLACISMVLMHTRTPAIAIVAVLAIEFAHKKKRPIDWLLFTLFVFGVLAIEIFQGTISGFVQELFPRQMSGGISSEQDLDVFLSGRVEIYKISWNDFVKSPIIGIGNWGYVDCFPLYVLRTGGLLSALLLYPIAYGLPFSYVKHEKQYRKMENISSYTKDVTYIARLLAIYYTILGISEASPPLGTGTMVFLPWLIFGMAARAREDEVGVVLPSQTES